MRNIVKTPASDCLWSLIAMVENGMQEFTVYADGLLLSNFLNNSFSTAPRWGMVSPEEIAPDAKRCRDAGLDFFSWSRRLSAVLRVFGSYVSQT